MRHKYKFTDKHNTFGGKIASLFGAASVVLIVYGLYVSFKAKGNGGTIVGIAGTVSFILATAGLILALSSFKEEDKFYALSWLGTILCAVVWILICALIVAGIY